MRDHTKKEVEEITPIVVPTYSEKENEKKGFFQKYKMKKQKRKQMKQEKVKEKKEKVLRQTPSILPFLQIDNDYILMKEGVMDILQIETKDLYSLNDTDLQVLLLARARFYRSYYEPLKVIALNFPSNTEKQKEYWLKKRGQTDDPLKLQFIDRKLFELDFLEKERTNREFFLFIYAENEQQLEERKQQVLRGMQQSFPLKKLSVEKKKDVLFVLNNQNTKL